MVPEVLFDDSRIPRLSFQSKKQDEFEESFLQYQDENSTEESNQSILDNHTEMPPSKDNANNSDLTAKIPKIHTENPQNSANETVLQKPKFFPIETSQQSHLVSNRTNSVRSLSGGIANSMIDHPQLSSIPAWISKTITGKSKTSKLQQGKPDHSISLNNNRLNEDTSNQIATSPKIQFSAPGKNNGINGDLKKISELFPDFKIKNLVYLDNISKSRERRPRHSKYYEPNLILNPARNQKFVVNKHISPNRFEVIMSQRIRINGDMILPSKASKIGDADSFHKQNINQEDQLNFSSPRSLAPFVEHISEISQNQNKIIASSLITEIIHKIQSLLNSQSRESIAKLSLEVNIKTLGNLEITFQEKGANLQITIHADNELVKSHLNDSRQELLFQMRRLGYDDISFDVNTNKRRSHTRNQRKSTEVQKKLEIEENTEKFAKVIDSITDEYQVIRS